MAEQTLWLIAAILIVIVVVVAVLALFGGQFGPFKQWLFKIFGQQELCSQLNTKGCTNSYRPQLENEKSGILYDRIGERLRDPNNVDSDANKAMFGEVCEYLGFTIFDDCLKACNCQTP